MNRITKTLALSLATLGALSACGGGADFAGDAPARITATLLDDEGGAMPSDPAALPADPAARALRAHHASIVQAAALEAARPGAVMVVLVDAAGQPAPSLELVRDGLALLPADTPVLVRGRDARGVARTADALVAQGHAPVWAVQ